MSGSCREVDRGVSCLSETLFGSPDFEPSPEQNRAKETLRIITPSMLWDRIKGTFRIVTDCTNVLG